jgi:L-ascorbate 6-phosphate lactonase
MLNLKYDIENTNVPSNSLVIFWIGQAGFILKTKNNTIITIDPYLSNSAEHMHNFKRIMPIPILPKEMYVNYVITTHEHIDHCDPDTISVISRDSKTRFIGPKECVKKFQKFGIDKANCFKIKREDTIDFKNIKVTGVYADHGKLSKDAIGVIIETDGIRIYHTGDTAYQPKLMQQVIDLKPDVIIPCINGKFGNLNPREAAKLSRDVNAKIAIASHFWMFAEQNGDPYKFIKACKKYAPNILPIVMQLGEKFFIRLL